MNRPGKTRRQMKRSIMLSASKFIAQRGHPRAFCSSIFPQSRHVLALMAVGPVLVVYNDCQRFDKVCG